MIPSIGSDVNQGRGLKINLLYFKANHRVQGLVCNVTAVFSYESIDFSLSLSTQGCTIKVPQPHPVSEIHMLQILRFII